MNIEFCFELTVLMESNYWSHFKNQSVSICTAYLVPACRLAHFAQFGLEPYFLTIFLIWTSQKSHWQLSTSVGCIRWWNRKKSLTTILLSFLQWGKLVLWHSLHCHLISTSNRQHCLLPHSSLLPPLYQRTGMGLNPEVETLLSLLGIGGISTKLSSQAYWRINCIARAESIWFGPTMD